MDETGVLFLGLGGGTENPVVPHAGLEFRGARPHLRFPNGLRISFGIQNPLEPHNAVGDDRIFGPRGAGSFLQDQKGCLVHGCRCVFVDEAAILIPGRVPGGLAGPKTPPRPRFKARSRG